MIRTALAVAVALAVSGCKKDAPDPAARGSAQTPPATPTTPTTPRQRPELAAGDTSGDYVEIDPRKPIGAPMAEYAKAAIAAGKKPYAYLHADWCKPCVAIATTRTSDPQMKDAFAGTVLLGIDIDRVPQQQLIDQSLSFSAIPVFYRLDATGVPDGESLDGGAWEEDIPANMAPPLKAFFAK